MAKKADLLAQAKDLGLEVTEKNTIAQIEEAIANAPQSNTASEEETVEKTDTAHVAKAGKRSQKALDEAQEKAEKEARKEAGDTSPTDGSDPTVKKGPKPITRPLIDRRGKKYQAAAKLIDSTKHYSLEDAADLAVKTSPSKFDATVEMHVRLGVDPRQADQNIRTTVTLPNGTGKKVRVAVFVPEADQKAAKEAGADIIGDDEFLKQLDKEQLDFDVLITTPQQMAKLGKYARLLGPRGLMPNPKSGTVATDVAAAVTAAKAGKVEYRVDKQAVVHIGIGKVSFGAAKITQNAQAFLDSLKAQKPASLKGGYVKSINVATTQGPGVKVENTIN